MASDRDVDLLVLGPLLAHHGGRPVELGPLRRRATLAALVVDAGHVVPLDTLLDRVWDGAPPDAAVAAVQAYVSRLRAAFRRAAGDDAGGPILTEQPGYRLAVDASDVDATRFETAVADARTARERGDLVEAARLVRAGLALWRGEPYADIGTAVARREAERLAGVRQTARVLDADLALALGRHADVVDDLRALLTETPLAEHTHGLYMTALYRSGRPAEAVGHFARVRELFADELGVDPGRDLQDLHARMLRADPSLDVAPSRAAVALSRPTAEPVEAIDTTPSAPRLIGRDREVAALVAAVDAALEAGSRAVAVVGEAGVGKTRLLEEGAEHARRRGATVAWGRSWQHDGAPRLWPFVQVLRTLTEQLSPDVVTAALGNDRGVLGALVPELSDSGDVGAAAGADLEQSELRVFDAVSRVLSRLAAAHHVVVVLEDMHWADAASRRLCEYLATHLEAAGIALVVSVRWPSDEGTAATGALLAGLARGQLVRIDLAGFDVDDVRAYVADRTGSVLDDATAAALVERTDGNPFFVGEIVRLVVTDGVAVAEAADEGVPDTVRAVVLARLARLEATDRAVLETASVVGRSFDLDLLVAAGGGSEDAVDEAVDRATAAGIVGTEPGHPGVHRFAHALVQQTLLESIGPSRRRRVHGRVAAVLQERVGADGGPRDPEQVVYHLAAAGGDEHLVDAVALSVDAAATARRRGDWALTESLLLRAVDVAARIRGPESAAAELSARLGLSSLYSLASPAAEKTDRQRDRVVDLARQVGDGSAVVAALAAVQAYWSTQGRIAEMEANNVELAAFAERMDDDVLRLTHLAIRAQTAAQRGHARAALDAADAALALLARPDLAIPFGAFPLEPRCAVRFWKLFALWLLGRDDEVVQLRRELGPVLADADVHTRLYTHTMLMELDAWRDAPEAAAVEALATRAAEREAGLVGQALHWIDPVDAWIRERLAPGSALDELAAAVAATEVLPTMAQRPYLRVMLGESLLRLGRVSEAGAQVDAGLAEIARTGERSFEPAVLGLAAHVATAGGDHAAAAAHRSRAAAVAAELGIRVPDRRP